MERERPGGEAAWADEGLRKRKKKGQREEEGRYLGVLQKLCCIKGGGGHRNGWQRPSE